MFGERVTDNLIPQLEGRSLANSSLMFSCAAADKIHSHAVFLSADVDTADTSVEAPEQHEGGGFPLPLTR